MGVADHVDQRYLADHCAEQFGMLCHDGRNQKPAIGAAHNAELLGRGDAALLDILRNRSKIVKARWR